MNFSNISSFDKIELITQNTLIICDIDETVLKFDTINPLWWKNTFNYYYSLSLDYDLADANTLADWIEFIKANNPIATDYDGLINLFNRAIALHSYIIFVTARTPNLCDLTDKHLQFINIPKSTVYHVGNIPKGEYIKLNIDIDKHEDIIFIDDYRYNLQSVYENFGEKIRLYKFN